jgi:hypothetical protein
MIITKSTRPVHPDDRLANWYSQRSTYFKSTDIRASDHFSSLQGSAEGFDADERQTSAEPLHLSILRLILAILGWTIPLGVGLLILALLHTFAG